MFRKSLTNRKGFTLVELLVVVAIIGILAAIAVPKFQSASESARGAKMQADLRTIDSAIAMAIAQGKTVADAAATLDANVTALLTTTPIPPTGSWRTASGHTDAQAPIAVSYGISGGRAVVSGMTADSL